MGAIGNLSNNYKKLGHKRFMERWKEGMMRVSPLQLVQIEFYSIIATMVGTAVSSILLIIFGLWYIIFALIFTLGIYTSQAISKWQQIQSLKVLGNFNSEDMLNKLKEMEG
jgi:uncharacterized membrane protein